MKATTGKLVYQKSNNYSGDDAFMWDVEITLKLPPMNSDDYEDLIKSMCKREPSEIDDSKKIIIIYRDDLNHGSNN